MKIIFALGNPGVRYATTRHNVGFIMIDQLAKKWDAEFTGKQKFNADVAEVTHDDTKIIIVKPTTFYNDTGIAARSLIDFYKIDPRSDFLVIHDDLALPFGTIRTRGQGTDAGNNGIKSLNAHLGSTYSRIRIGIYNSLRDQIDDANFVLSNFTIEEKKALPALYAHVDQFISAFLQGKLEITKVNVLPG